MQQEERVDVATVEVAREERGLTRVAFKRLLDWLDNGSDSHGETYLEMRRRLVLYFDRRNRPFADELADETLNRVGRTLEKSGSIEVTPPARYCYVVARFVLLEDIRRGRRYVHVDEAGPAASPRSLRAAADANDSGVVLERRLECLDRCLQKLKPAQRELAIEYYRDAKRERIDRRRELANRLGISLNALGIRAWRIRATLEACVAACSKRRAKGFTASGPME
jgi:DNA-directed RNA polymerase specialized sigma24 family protein